MLDAIKSNLLHDLDCNVKVIVISANGKVFSSGHDLKELVRQSPLIKLVMNISWLDSSVVGALYQYRRGTVMGLILFKPDSYWVFILQLFKLLFLYITLMPCTCQIAPFCQ